MLNMESKVWKVFACTVSSREEKILNRQQQMLLKHFLAGSFIAKIIYMKDFYEI
jgi:hypothetical protein